MKKSLRFAVAAAAMGMAATASAGYFEIGAEIEDYNGNSSADSFYMPYMLVGGNPIEGSDLALEWKTTRRLMDSPDKRPDALYRQEFTVGGYSWSHGNYTFSPRYRLRMNFNGDSRVYEHRIFPNMSYSLNDTFSLQLDGFVAPVQRANQDARGTDDRNQKHDYLDYIHELDMRLNTRISDTQSLRVSIYNEYGRTTDLSKNVALDAGETRNAHEWQLRLVYTQNFGDFTLSPFARIGLSKTAQRVDGNKLDQNRHRVGLAGSYKLSNDLSLVGETYFQTRKQQGVANGDIYDRDNQNYMFYQVGVRYSF